MIRSQPARILLSAAIALSVAACGAENADAPEADGAAAGNAPPQIAERQDNFEKIGDSFKVIRANFEEGAETDLAAVEAAARDIGARAGSIKDHFPAGSGMDAGFDTEALASIWERPEEFAAAHEKLIEESGRMAEIAASGDAAATGAQIAELGGSCKNCHDNFRVKKD